MERGTRANIRLAARATEPTSSSIRSGIFIETSGSFKFSFFIVRGNTVLEKKPRNVTGLMLLLVENCNFSPYWSWEKVENVTRHKHQLIC